jgi:DNA-binding MarR family transcriptional regulator
LVERLSVEGDRRAFLVRLTAAGRASFADMARAHEGWIVQAFGDLSDKDMASLHKLLGRVKHTASSIELTENSAIS